MLSKFIREFDLFGHTIELNFNKEGSTYKTFIGGLISLIVKIFLLYYLILKTYVLVTFGDNTVTYQEAFIDKLLNMNTELVFDQTGLNVALAFYTQGWVPLPIKDFSQYIEVNALVETINWSKPPYPLLKA